MTTFERAAKAHIASRGSPGTRSLYTADLVRWLAFCQLEDVDPDEPTLEAATKHRDALVRSYAPLSVRRTLSALSSMYDAAGLPNLFKSSKRLQRPPADDVVLTRSFTDEEARALLDAAKAEPGTRGLRDYALLCVLYDAGPRISAVVAMRCADLFRSEANDGEVVDKFVWLTAVKKRGRVEIILPATSAAAIDRWLEARPGESPWVFPSDRGSGHLTRDAVNKRMKVYGERTKVKGASPHRFRATYITAALDAGIPLNEVQASVHHSDPKTTQRYDRGKRGAGVSTAVSEFRKRRKT